MTLFSLDLYGCGVFDEDMIVVTQRRHENLSASLPKRAADIERLMKR
jgi:hypothetical protein